MSARRQQRLQLTRNRRRSDPAPAEEAGAVERVGRPAGSSAASAAAERLLAEIDDVLSE
jgi:hypothetical protein